MADAGINAIRLYTSRRRGCWTPRRRHGLWVAVDVPWEEHITFLDQARPAGIDPVARIADGVRRMRRAPGRPRVQHRQRDPLADRPLARRAAGRGLPGAARRHGPRRPTPARSSRTSTTPRPSICASAGIDYESWNVYLERTADFERYVARLQNLAARSPGRHRRARRGQPPARGTESRRSWWRRQVRCGVRGRLVGHVRVRLDGRVGAQRRRRRRLGLRDRPRASGSPSRRSVPSRRAYREVPFPDDLRMAAHLGRLLQLQRRTRHRRLSRGAGPSGLPRLRGHRHRRRVDRRHRGDRAGYDVTLVSTPNQGLSARPQRGAGRATGEITAYIDDDAYPDQDWLRYLGWLYMTTDHAGVGGPNLPPPGDGPHGRARRARPRRAATTCCAPIPRPSTSRAATPRTAPRPFGRSAATTRASGPRATTSTSAGGSRSAAARSASPRERWSGTTAAALRAATSSSSAATATPRRSSSGSGRRGSIDSGTSRWPGQLYGPGARPGAAVGRRASTAARWGSAPYQSIYERTSALGGGAAHARVVDDDRRARPRRVARASPGRRSCSRGRWRWRWLGRTLVVAWRSPLDALRGSRLPAGEHAAAFMLLTALVLGQSLYRTRGRLAGGLDAVPPTRANGCSRAARTPARGVERGLASHGGAAPRRGGAARPARASPCVVAVTIRPWDLEVRTGAFAQRALLGTVEEHGHGSQMVRWRVWPRVGWIGVADRRRRSARPERPGRARRRACSRLGVGVDRWCSSASSGPSWTWPGRRGARRCHRSCERGDRMNGRSTSDWATYRRALHEARP